MGSRFRVPGLGFMWFGVEAFEGSGFRVCGALQCSLRNTMLSLAISELKFEPSHFVDAISIITRGKGIDFFHQAP